MVAGVTRLAGSMGPGKACGLFQAGMESDESVNEALRLQFRALQEQQQKRLQRLMERRKEKPGTQEQTKPDTQEQTKPGTQEQTKPDTQEQTKPDTQEQTKPDTQEQTKPGAFGVQDQLNLLQLDRNSSNNLSNRILEDENERLQGQLREVQDENGRLHKLLKEKEFEIRHLRRKVEEDKLALAGTAGLAGDVAATKIVELSKKNRELSAELESERNRARHLTNRTKELERELQSAVIKLPPSSEKDLRNGPTVSRSVDVSAAESSEMKVLQDKLAAANLKLTEYRNQIQSTKQELRMAHKVLANEVGEEVNIAQLVSSPGGWRGRAQQILALQGRVRELEGQLGQVRSPASELSLEEEMMGASRRLPAQEKNLFRLRSLEKERKETLERLMGEYEALKKEHEELKKKLEASKARNKSLSNDLKSGKLQLSTLLEKGRHDDELIDALLSQQRSMQEVLTRLSLQDEKHKDSQQTLNLHLNNESQKQNCLVAQLKQMLAEREAKVRELEEELQQLTAQTPPRRADGVTGEAEERQRRVRWSPDRPHSGDHVTAAGSARTVSKLGHELVESGTAAVSTAASPESPEFRALQTQMAELRALSLAAEVERDRLTELVSVLQRREEESNSKVLEAERKLQEERRRCVHLEQQLEKMRLEAGKNGVTPKLSARNKAGQSLSNSRLFLNFSEISDLPSNVPLEAQLEELRTKLDIKMDENEALKSALKSALKTKEEDLKLYNDMMVQVKQIFLQALRQHRQERSAP